MSSFEAVEGMDPGRVLRPGRFDPLALLILWSCRRAFFPMLWVGLTIPVISGWSLEALIDRLNSVGDLTEAVFSPLAVLVITILIRVLVGWLGVLLAYPLSRADFTTALVYRNRWRIWQDRYYRTTAFTDLRWAWAVREVAVARLGETGRLLALCDPVLRWLNFISFGVLAISIVVRATQG